MCGEKRHQEHPGAEGESLWSGFIDAEDKGISRKMELSASELLQKGPEVDETWKLGDVAGHSSVGGKMVVKFFSVKRSWLMGEKPLENNKGSFIHWVLRRGLGERTMMGCLGPVSRGVWLAVMGK